MTDIRKWDFGGAIPTSTPSPSKNKSRSEKSEEPKSKFYARGRARLNRIPSPDELSHLIDKALNALSRGVFWDRGSIINILL